MKLFDSNLENIFTGRDVFKNTNRKLRIPRLLHDLYIEEKCPVDKYKQKLGYQYDGNIERLVRNGWERNMTPQEYFSLMMAYEEGKIVDTDLDSVAEDINRDFVEFTSSFVEKSGDVLLVYKDVNAVCWNKDDEKYIFASEEESGRVAEGFWWDILENDTNLEAVNLVVPDFVKYLFGRKYDDLPKPMKRTTISISSRPGIWPIGISKDSSPNKYSIMTEMRYLASRGVKKR